MPATPARGFPRRSPPARWLPRISHDLCTDLYDALARLNPPAAVELNRAVAVGLAPGPAAGGGLVESLLERRLGALR